MSSIAPAAGRLLPRREDLRAMLRLALPVVVIQVGMMAMGVVDTIMVGHLSAQCARRGGAGQSLLLRPRRVRHGHADGAWTPSSPRRLARGTSRRSRGGSSAACCWPDALPVPRRPPAARRGAVHGARPAAGRGRARTPRPMRVRMAPGVLPFFVFVVLRQSLQAMQPHGADRRRHRRRQPGQRGAQLGPHLRPLRAPRRWASIGSAWATTLSRWLLAILLLALSCGPTQAVPVAHSGPRSGSGAPLGRMLRLGVPIGCQYALEFGAFALVALMMGWLGTRAMAGPPDRHQPGVPDLHGAARRTSDAGFSPRGAGGGAGGSGRAPGRGALGAPLRRRIHELTAVALPHAAGAARPPVHRRDRRHRASPSPSFRSPASSRCSTASRR